MSDPLLDPSDLGTYLSDPGINVERAAMLIQQSQALCESIINPLPAVAVAVVTRVAGRAYTTILSPRQQQAAAAGGQFVGSFGGGVYLSADDVADLRRLNGGGGAFSIDMLPADYVAPYPVYLGLGDWDQIS